MYRKDFEEYLLNYKPLPWTVVKNHENQKLNNNNSLLISYERFYIIMKMVNKYLKTNSSILDVGIYPGIMPKIFHEFYPKKNNYNYFGAGLGFSEEFRKEMRKLKVKLIDVDLDKRMIKNKKIKSSISLSEKNIDFVFLTDVIEHFFDPMNALYEINRISKMGSNLILTTDNLTRFHLVLAALRGRSNNVPLNEGHFFFDGDWRPHFREYSKNELMLMLKWAGYSIVEHQYFSAKHGEYKIQNGKITKINNQSISIKNNLIKFSEKILSQIFPHFKDNQIIVAEKSQEYSDLSKTSPKIVSDPTDWMELRKKYSE